MAALLYTRAQTLKVIHKLGESQKSLAKIPYVVLRNGYDCPFYYSEAIDYEVHDADDHWYVLITPGFYEFWPRKEVRGAFQYKNGVWTSAKPSRERHRTVDN